MKRLFPAVQKLGRSLMLPIAVLPVAGLLLRLGQPDLLDLPYVAAAGNAVFSHLGLLFAIGVAVGLARGNHGAAGLAAVVAYLVTTEGARVLIPVPESALDGAEGELAGYLSAAYLDAAISKMSVPVGLISGILAGLLYNRFADIRLPDALAFFAGRRFVPIVSGFAALGLAAIFGFGWPHLEAGMNGLSEAVTSAGGVGLFIYGLLNRLLIVTGLHHILNNIAWFIVGDYEGVTGDLRRFFAGDPAAGVFMTGFFPVMMFGLPAACLAMYHCAEPGKRKAVGGLLLSMGLTSFLTGITEPIEFTFMFIAPALYALHAVLTGISMALMDVLGVRHGFGFSAGLFDYVLNYSRATRPLVILAVGAAWFALYYVVFRWTILRFDIPTPGRGNGVLEGTDERPPEAGGAEEVDAYLEALGGRNNLREIDACTTRLRLLVKDPDLVNEGRLKALGAAGVLSPAPGAVQVIVGLRADEIAERLREAAGSLAATPRPSVDDAPATRGEPVVDPGGLLSAVGGPTNIRGALSRGTRLPLELNDTGRIDEAALQALGCRGVARLAGTEVQLLFHDDAHGLAEVIRTKWKPAPPSA